MNLARLRAQLEQHEGRRTHPYTDTVGKLTIGVGRNLTDVGLFDDEITRMLENDLARTWGGLIGRLPWVAGLDEVRQRALIDLGFMGIGSLLTFHKMLTALHAKDYETAARELLDSTYAAQTKGRAVTLAEMLRTGTDPT